MGYSKVFTLGYLSVTVSLFHHLLYLRSIDYYSPREHFNLRAKPGKQTFPAHNSSNLPEYQKFYSPIIYDKTLLLGRAPAADPLNSRTIAVFPGTCFPSSTLRFY